MKQSKDHSHRISTPEEELKLAQERFNVIFQNTTVSIWDYIFETKQIIQPTRSQELHGFDRIVENVPEGLIESGFIHPDSAQEFREMYEKLFAGAERAEGVFRVQTADRSGYWYEHIRYHALFDEEGKPYAAVGMSTDVTDEIELQKKVESDPLTGLLNKEAFQERLRSILSRFPDQQHILVNMDLDDFKQINDRYGHATGDEMLRCVARRVAQQAEELSDTTFVARAGGDEFMVLLCDTSRNAAVSFAQTLLNDLKMPLTEGIGISGSIGIAVYPKDGETLQRIELAADRALYSVKRQEKNGYCFYGDNSGDSILQVQHRQQFLSDTMSGGMIGGYREPGLPLYFVDDSLLSWLGYESKEEFTADIDGLVKNGIHPDDRDFVLEEMDRQLGLASRYVVEYRMRKRDGSYIWVHDVGEQMTAPDGRQAITAACYDISAEKERDNLLDNLLGGMEAKVALYRVEANGILKLLHASQDVMEITHYSDEEYREICKDDAMNFVYTQDREQVKQAIRNSVKEESVITESFRLLDKRGGYTWVTGVISRLGSDNGLPVVRIIFMPLSLQNDLQLQMLDSKYIGVYVIDEETNELYYANETSLKMHDAEPMEITGMSCHQVFYGQDTPCRNCWRNQEGGSGEILYRQGSRILSIEVQRRVWNNRNIAIAYSRDVTDQYELQKQQQALFDHIPAGLSLLAIKDGKITPIFFSSAMENLLGIKIKDLMEGMDNEAFFHCVHPDDLPRIMNQMREDVAAGRSGSYYKYRCWNENRGEYLWIELHANTVKNGDEILVYATYNDLTNANHVQNELEKNQRAMDTIINYANLGVWSYDLDTKEVQQEYSQTPAYGSKVRQENVPESFIHQGSIHKDDAATYRECYARILSGESTSDCIVRVYDYNLRAYLWMHIYLIRQKDTLDGKRRALGFSLVIDQEVRSIKALEKAESAVRESQEMLETACSFAGVHVINYDIVTKTAYIGNTTRQAFSLPEKMENFPDSMDQYPVILPEYREAYRQKVEALRTGESEIELEFEARHSDGRPHWLRLKGYLLPSHEKGKIAIISAQNIDAEKAMSARLLQEREKLQSKDKNLLHYYVADLTTEEIIEYKSEFMDQPAGSGIPMEEYFLSCGSHIAFSADYHRVMEIHDRKRLLDNYAKGITQEQYDAQLEAPDGTILWTNCILNLLEDPVSGDVLLYEYVYDMSEEEILTIMLKRNMDYGYEMVGHWIAEKDQLTFLEANQDVGRSQLNRMLFFDYTQNYAEKHIHPEDRDKYLSYREELIEMWKQGNEEYRDVLYRTIEEDGSLRYHKADAYYYDKEKGIFLMTCRDYTDVVQKEAAEKQQIMEALEEAKQANKAKNDFMARMSHDMRTPMNAILGMTHLAAHEEKNPKTLEYIEQIEESSRYLLGVINDILEMGRIESGKAQLTCEWCTWKEILKPVLHMMEPTMAKKGIHFEYHKEGMTRFPIEFYVDKQKTQQMLMNLLNNACKFTPEGGTIRLTFTNVLLNEEEHTSVDRILIEDTGCGMSKEFMKHIFQPFEQERLPGSEGIPGTGLGLAIARSIARQIGGDITVESQLNKGSVFTITYPYRYRSSSPTKESCQEPPIVGEELQSMLNGKRVLLVEDNKINATIAMKILEKKGIQAVLAENGKIAVERFAQEPEGSFDLILMDIRMPVMDGLEATRQIRGLEHADARRIPIIAMSANAYEEDRKLSLHAGMNEHLSKPVEPEKLYRTIGKYI